MNDETSVYGKQWDSWNSHIFLTATLARPEVGAELEQYLRLPQPS